MTVLVLFQNCSESIPDICLTLLCSTVLKNALVLIWVSTTAVLELLFQTFVSFNVVELFLTLLHSERPELYTILAFLSATGLKCCSTNLGLYQSCSGILLLELC